MEEDIHHPLDHFKYLVMPFSLTNTLDDSQTMVIDIPRDVLTCLISEFLDGLIYF